MLRSFGAGRAVKREIDEELHFHLEQRAAEHLASGMPPEAAARAARKRFGNLQRFREECRDICGASLGETLLQDIRFGLRMLVKKPGFTAVAVFSLAIGIGLNSTMFSLIDQTSLEELPVREPGRVFTIKGKNDFLDDGSSFAHLDRQEFLKQCPSLAAVAAEQDEAVIAHHRQMPCRLHAKVVSRNYFSFFGLRPALGRFFQETDGSETQAEPVVVISYSLWQRDFGCDPGVIGRRLQLDNRTLTVLGVGPKGFVGTFRWAPEDLWIPAEVHYAGQPKFLSMQGVCLFSMLARLRPDVTPEVAQSEVQVVTERLVQTYPSKTRTRDAHLSPLVSRKGSRYYLEVIGNMLLPGVVLALACANVSALLIARAQSRTREIATRLALGSSRGRLVRQLLVESLLLAAGGSLAGLALSGWTIRTMPSLLPPSPEIALPDLYVDGRVVLFTAVVAVFATFCFGLLPAWHATNPELATLLKGDSETGPVGRRCVGLNRIVIGQLTLSLVLLCIAGLFLRSSLRALQNHPGFQRSDLLLVELNPSQYGLDLPRIPAYLRQVQEKLQTLPGVQRVCTVGAVPMEYKSSWNRTFFIARDQAGDAGGELNIHCNPVSEEVFDLMGFRLLQGRKFTRSDDETSALVTLVSQAAAQAYWPGRNPVGQVVRLGGADGSPYEVIGVVADGTYNLNDGRHQPYLFFPCGQLKLYGVVTFLAETRVPPRNLFAATRAAVREVDERVLPVGIRTLHDTIRGSYSMFGRQFLSRLFGVFGALGLVLALIGLYAVTAYAVGRRTREIGIRMALGATRGTVLRLVLVGGLRMALMGVALGLPVAFGAAQLLRNGLYGFPPTDPVTFVGVPLLLLAVALLACWLPARRAARVQPMEALRHE